MHGLAVIGAALKGPTPALSALWSRGVNFEVFTFDHDAAIVEQLGYGRAAAQALGIDESRVFKTLLAKSEVGPVVAIIAVNAQLSLRSLATHLGVKRCEMVMPDDARKITGYVVGGISPFGQKRTLPTVIDEGALRHATILVSGGKRGLDVEVAVADLIAVLDATVGCLAVISE